MVERQLPKLYVEGSIPFARSNIPEHPHGLIGLPLIYTLRTFPIAFPMVRSGPVLPAVRDAERRDPLGLLKTAADVPLRGLDL